MDEVVELESLHNVCRLCLSADEPKSPIFGVQEATVPLAEKIQECLSIEVFSDDKLTTLICGSCVRSVNQWHTYRESCLRSQEKLQRWLDRQGDMITTVKSEPLDAEEDDMYEEQLEIPPEVPPPPQQQEEEEMEEEEEEEQQLQPRGTKRRRSSSPAGSGEVSSPASGSSHLPPDLHHHDVDSVAGHELLINPMAVAKDIDTGDALRSRKRLKRGPHTHFRGVKVFKRKCPHCMIHLHSKFSYAKHMERYHRNAQKPTNGPIFRPTLADDTEDVETVEDVEDELISLEKNAPLTQVQESIISQLKTFSCYSCQQVFNDRRSTLNHIRQHMPDLRPYTCIACLTEFPDRSIYKLHCGASFECAMKIALVVPKHGTEKYFTCNMCLRPMSNRKELLAHLAKHSDKQYEQLTNSAPVKSPPQVKSPPRIKINNPTGPYRHGDPAHNHTCDYCGMIYRYKPNMLKHEDLCKRLPPDERTSYRCAHCGMTFLVFKKFQSHVNIEHNRKDLVCFTCSAKFKHSNEYLVHHQQHRTGGKVDATKNVWKNYNSSLAKVTMKFGCATCPQEFLTKEELNVHRATHSKSKSQPELVNHDDSSVVEPEISYTVEHTGKSTECTTCGKVFANYPNLRRHIRTVHIVAGRFSCPKCPKTFTSEDLWNQHAERAHPKDIGTDGSAFRCLQCKKVLDSQDALNNHLQEEHDIAEDDHLACDICGKRFSNETSLKIHRGHHFRRDSRLSIRALPHPLDQVQVEMREGPNELSLTPRPAKAKKSFPSPFKPAASPANLQCAVCDDAFSDVAELRKHLWEVHCQKHKSEKSFVGDLQCELCTNVFPDTQALEEHMRWHKENPILAEVTRPVDISCDICGKYYSSTKALWKHKKLHKTTPVTGMKFQSLKKNTPTSYPCPVCKKIFNNETSMKKHKAAAHYVRKSMGSVSRKSASVTPHRADEDARPKRPKLDFDMIRKAYHLGEPSGSSFGTPNTTKKPVTCGICKKLLPSMSSLYKHRQNVHKSSIGKPLDIDEGEVNEGDGVPCTECYKVFSNTANMKQHYTKVHGNGDKHYCTMDDCEEVFDTSLAKQAHEKTHMNILYSCNLCSRHMFNRSAIDKHLATEHGEEVTEENAEKFYKKTDLGSYIVKGADGRVCPICKIKYPNIKAMKIHYVKIHEGAS